MKLRNMRRSRAVLRQHVASCLETSKAVQEGRRVRRGSAKHQNLASGWCNMSAMHWEARRRQQVLDRRLSARVMQTGNQDKKKEESTAPMTPYEPAGSSEDLLEADKQCICKCHAKMNKRYTSLQYSQQW